MNLARGGGKRCLPSRLLFVYVFIVHKQIDAAYTASMVNNEEDDLTQVTKL